MKQATRAPVYAVLFTGLSDIVRSHGYALAAHGSMQTDMDVVAIPWTEGATSAEELVEGIVEYLSVFSMLVDGEVKRYGPEQKPHGRVAWVLALGYGAQLDISIMPKHTLKNSG